MSLNLNFQNKKVIITGGSMGLGYETARLFVSYGADVCICSRNYNELENAAKKLESYKKFSSQKIIFTRADVGFTNEIDELINFAKTNFKTLDVLVNCAGIYGPIGSLDENSWDEWDYTVRVNLLGAVYIVRAFISELKANNKSGKIICMSGGGATKGMPNFSAYAATKSGVVRTIETVAQELKGSGIEINCVAPGALNTRMLEQAINAGENSTGHDMFKKLLQQKENGGASITNAAELIAFLASDLSNGISGRLISAVWDDWKNLPEHKNELDNSDVYTLRRIIPSERGFNW